MIMERPQDLAGMFALRRALRPGQTKSVPAAHAGLGLDVYTQVTSPLRRYLDLVAHQQLRAYLRGETPLDGQALLERVGAAAALSEDVRRAERLARRHWTLVYLMQHADWEGQGILVEKRDRRGIVLVPELDLEVTLHLRQDLALNSEVPLALDGVNLPELTAHMKIVG